VKVDVKVKLAKATLLLRCMHYCNLDEGYEKERTLSLDFSEADI